MSHKQRQEPRPHKTFATVAAAMACVENGEWRGRDIVPVVDMHTHYEILGDG